MAHILDKDLEIRDTIFTTRGFLLRSIQAAAGNIHKEKEAWKVYYGVLNNLEISEVYTGLHTSKYILPSGYSFETERLDRGDGIDQP